MNKAIIAIVGISLIVVVLMIFMFYSSYQANLEAENQQAYYDAMIWWQMTKEEAPTNGEELPEGAVARRV